MKDKKNVIYNSDKVFLFQEPYCSKLIKLATDSQTGTARICLHSNNSETTQSMIICLMPNKQFERHYHGMGKSESYTIIRGTLYVDLFEAGLMSPSRTVKLSRENTPYMHRGMTIHRPYTRDELCIYHEVYHGTYTKEVDVIQI